MEVERRATPYGPFPVDYLECPLIDLCVPEGGVQTGPFGSQLHKRDYVEVGTPIITVEHLGDNRILHDATPKVSDADRDRLSRYQLRPGDIVFSRVGSVDRRALVNEEEAGWLFSGRCLRVRPNPELIDPTYLSYFFGLETFKEYVRSIAVGATMPSINTAILSNVPVIFPPSIHEQQAIASILKALDDKIELNRRMSNTLEEIGRTLFRAWFIDFTAKPSSGSSTSTKGKSPPDWHLGTIGDLVERRTQRIGDASATVLSAIAEGALVRSEDYFKKRVHSKSISKYIAVHQWDFAYNPSRINIGSIGLHKESFLGAVSPVYIVARPKPEYRWFLRFFLLEESTKEWIRTLSSGSVRQSLSFDAFASIPCIIPRPPDMETFNDTWKKLWSAIRLRELESATLSQIRDTLLPRLISGELRVHEAEQFVSEVV